MKEAFYRYTEMGTQMVVRVSRQEHQVTLTTTFVWSGNLLGIWAGRSDGERDHATGGGQIITAIWVLGEQMMVNKNGSTQHTQPQMYY